MEKKSEKVKKGKRKEGKPFTILYLDTIRIYRMVSKIEGLKYGDYFLV